MIRIGLLGAAWITPMAILEPAKLLPDVEVIALAARDPNRAQSYADEHNIAHVEPTYDALLARPDLDLIYIALPVSLHEKWASRALVAGKHVLCEKPLVMNASQARNLAKAAQTSCKSLIEAFHYWHHPYFKRIMEIAQSGELGQIRQITGRLHVPVPVRAGQIRHDPAMGGGALLDLGCYPLHMMRSICGMEPVITSATGSIGPSGVDLSIKAKLTFSNGAQGLIDCAMPETGELFGELIIEGKHGHLHASKPILPHLGGVLHIDTPAGNREEKADEQSSFFYQLKTISSAIQNETPPALYVDDFIGNSVALDAIRTAAEI
ncbi:MAG: hypothetical protein COA47_03210 [Robiginitomaculum sp.]|nr:MAG: hypothetical protein COA47_03210 [Robiginitomaculum sp.]